MRSIFQDKHLESEFRRKGYIILPLLSAVEAKDYYEKAKRLKSGVSSHFYTSLWSNDPDYRKQADQLVKDALLKKALPYFNNYIPLFGDLLVKRPSLSKNFPMHQDWTFVDESGFTSVYIWCPLQDVTPRNGCLQVVEGSHQALDPIRGANVPVSYEDIRHRISKDHLQSVPLKAGECIIFSQALLHASPPNHSFKKRIAIGLLVVPEEAELFHYYYDRAEKELYKLKVDLDFFMHYSERMNFKESLEHGTFALPDPCEVMEKHSYTPEPLSLPDFQQKIQKAVL